MTELDLHAVLASEIARHVATLVSDAPLVDKHRAVHSARGAAAIAGVGDLAAQLLPLEQRLRAGDESAVAEAHAVLLSEQKRERPKHVWPDPPPWLEAREVDASIRADYTEETAKHVARLRLLDVVRNEAEISRIVHTLKGSSSIVRDEATAWFCHGLEEHVLGVDPAHAPMSLQDAVDTIAELVASPAAALARLRGVLTIPELAPHASELRRTAPPKSEASLPPPQEETARVPVQSLDHLHTTLASFDAFDERLRESARASSLAAKELEGLRREVQSALGILGPPKPWGVSERAVRTLTAVASSIASMSDRAEDTATRLRELGTELSSTVTEGKRELGAMQRTTPRRLLSILEGLVTREAARAGARIELVMFGDDVSIDRRLLDALGEPLMHLARNAVAHGALGRAGATTRIEIGAEKAGPRVLFTIADNGPGIDRTRLLERARELGYYQGAEPDPDALYELLFLPGFSTKNEADHLAGRGMGLDIARLAVQRHGGTLRIGSRHGRGFSATVDVPQDPGQFPVVWVLACGAYFGVPARHVLRIDTKQTWPEPPQTHLASILDGGGGEAGFAITLGEPEHHARAVTVGVDGVGAIESALVRSFTPIASTWGPYVGACPQSDGTLRLILDHVAVATTARARGAA